MDQLQGLAAGGADQEEGPAADQAGQQLTGGAGDHPGGCTGSRSAARERPQAGPAGRSFLAAGKTPGRTAAGKKKYQGS